MKTFKIALTLICFLFGVANAATTSQTLCFASQKNSRVELVLRKYVDEDLQKEVGAFAKYSTGKSIIPLVFTSDSTTDDSVDYELHWLEIYNEKITGKYRLLKPKKATILGAYVKYKNLRTGKEIVFTPTAKSENECSEMLK